MRQNSCKTGQKVQSSVFCGKLVVMNVVDERTVSGKLFQTDAAAAGKARSPMLARTVRGATSADVDDERSRRGLRRVEDLTPGSRGQSRGDSDTLALPAGTKSVQEPEASVGSSTVAARGHWSYRQALKINRAAAYCTN